MHLSLRLRRAVPIAAALAALAPGAAQAATVDFAASPTGQAWTVPTGVTSITVDLHGSAGQSNPGGVAGGSGARLQTTLSVTAGQSFELFVGGYGTNGGGGSPGKLGGGATDLRQAPYGLANRIAVAGGGGGAGAAGSSTPGLAAGGSSGASGANPNVGGGCDFVAGGSAGSQTTGGAGGIGAADRSGYNTTYYDVRSATEGGLGDGGGGGRYVYLGGNNTYAYGGGGGGGYYGGGGGGADLCRWGTGGGGGGGSSLVPAFGELTDGANAGLGHATITYTDLPPVNTATPVVSGSTTIPGTLATTDGEWDNTPTGYTYEWQRCAATCDTVPSATSKTYETTSADQGATIRSIVSATNGGGTAQATSQQTAVLSVAAPLNTAAPVVSGPTSIAGTLTTTNGEWDNDPTGYSYVWQRCTGSSCITVPGATSKTYPTSTNDEGKTVRSIVYAANPAGKVGKVSDRTAVLTGAVAPVNSTAPVVSGPTTIPGTLTTTNGEWDNNPTSYTYVWQRCTGSTCVTVPEVTGTTYATSSADEGKTVRTIVYAANLAGKVGKTSDRTPTLSGAIAPVNMAAPVVSGPTSIPGTLTTTNGGWDNAPTSYSYIWQRCTGSSCVTVPDVTGTTYATSTADEGKTVRVIVYAANRAGKVGKISDRTAVLSGAVAPVNSTAPVVSGPTTIPGTLTTSNGEWDNNPTSYTYVWQRCTGTNCVTVPGKTSSTYETSSADDGKTIRSIVYAANRAGKVGKVSARTATITGEIIVS